MIDFQEAFKEACLELMPDKGIIEQNNLIEGVNELSKRCKYAI